MKQRALLVGINTYADKAISDLSCAISDASALGVLFELMGFTVHVLNESCTTCSNVNTKFEELMSDMDEGDVFLFYFAGHGVTRKGDKTKDESDEQLLVCRDDGYSRICNEGIGGLKYKDLETAVVNRGCHAIFILDACRTDISSAMVLTRGMDCPCPTRDLIPISGLVGAPKDAGSFVVMHSCHAGERSHEVTAENQGLYTLALKKVVMDRYQQGPGIVFDESLNAAVKEEMKRKAKTYGIEDLQEPEFVRAKEGNLPYLRWRVVGGVGGGVGGGDKRVPRWPPPTEEDEKAFDEAIKHMQFLCGSDTVDLSRNRKDAEIRENLGDVYSRLYDLDRQNQDEEQKSEPYTESELTEMKYVFEDLYTFLQKRIKQGQRVFLAKEVRSNVRKHAGKLLERWYDDLARQMLQCVDGKTKRRMT